MRTRSRPPRSSGLRALGALLALAVVVGIAIFVDLGRPYFWDPGEGRYAETVREMLLTGDWMRPTLNFAHYFDKPPAFYWLVAVAFRALGPTEWAARLPAAIAAVATIAATVGFAWRRMGLVTAVAAGAILASAVQFVVLARSVRMDMPLTALVAGTLFCAYAVWERDAEGGPSAPTWPLYVLAALGVLVKGPVALLLPILIVLALAALTGEYRRLLALRPGVGATAAAAIGLSWYVAAAIVAPDYLWMFLWRHNLGRFVGATSAGHAAPFWFYVWVLPMTFLPWTIFLPGALRRGVRRARRGHDLELFLTLWIGVSFVFFSVSRAKLATYLLPVFPPLALLVAAYLERVVNAPASLQRRALRLPALAWCAGMAASVLAIVIAIATRYPAYAGRVVVASPLLVFPALGWRAVRDGRWPSIPVLVLLGAVASQAAFYRIGTPVVNDFSSWHDAATVARELPSEAAIYAYKTRGHSFIFYAERSTTRLRSPQAVAQMMAREQPTGLVTKVKYLERFRPHLTVPLCVWWQSPSGRVLLANRPRPGVTGGTVIRPLAADGSPPGGTGAAPGC